MTKIPKVSPSTLAELKTNILTLRTKLEQIEYLSVVILDLQNEDGRWVTYGEEYEKNKANCEELIQEMTVFAKNKIKNLGGRPIKWIEYPIVSSIGQYNEVKESFKDDGKLLEWVKWLLSNIEHHVRKSSTFLERKFNDRVLRQLFLDSTDKGEEYGKFVMRWGEAQRLDDNFENYLERQLKILSLVVPPNKPENNFFENFEDTIVQRKQKPHTAFIVVAKTEMKIERGKSWKAMLYLAQRSRGQTEVKLPSWGKTYLRRVRLKSEHEILYSHEQFDYDKAENLPDGVFLITHNQFDKTWTTTAQQEI